MKSLCGHSLRTGISLFFLLQNLPAIVYAEDGSAQFGTLTRIEGTVQLLNHPLSTLPAKEEIPKDSFLTRYEGFYYAAKAARPGDPFLKGSILKTLPDSKARIVFKNGDQFNVGPSSYFEFSRSQKTRSTELKLNYGIIRGIIEKGGPMSNLKIKTRAATMGVRGTDFSVYDTRDSAGVSVLRGSVMFESNSPQSKKLEVKSGQSAISTPRKTYSFRLSKEVLEQIKNDTSLKKSVPRAERRELDELETAAARNSLKDIARYTPEVARSLQEKQISDVDSVNDGVITVLSKDAPSIPTPGENGSSLPEEMYRKYFNSK